MKYMNDIFYVLLLIFCIYICLYSIYYELYLVDLIQYNEIIKDTKIIEELNIKNKLNEELNIENNIEQASIDSRSEFSKNLQIFTYYYCFFILAYMVYVQNND